MFIGKIIFWTVMTLIFGLPALGLALLFFAFLIPSGDSSPFGYALQVDTQKQIKKDIWGDIFD